MSRLLSVRSTVTHQRHDSRVRHVRVSWSVCVLVWMLACVHLLSLIDERSADERSCTQLITHCWRHLSYCPHMSFHKIIQKDGIRSKLCERIVTVNKKWQEPYCDVWIFMMLFWVSWLLLRLPMCCSLCLLMHISWTLCFIRSTVINGWKCSLCCSCCPLRTRTQTHIQFYSATTTI